MQDIIVDSLDSILGRKNKKILSNKIIYIVDNSLIEDSCVT
jgi:hypothetical protein